MGRAAASAESTYAQVPANDGCGRAPGGPADRHLRGAPRRRQGLRQASTRGRQTERRGRACADPEAASGLEFAVLLAHFDEETSNALFDTLADWNTTLKKE